MPYPYKKMTEEDFAYIRSVTSEDRVWVGDAIAREFYRDEMPEYGVFPPELYVEVENRDEISAIMKYAYEKNIPVVCRGAGTGLAGGATCKYGGIMLSVMRMNRIFPVDHKNQTITCEPGALLLDVQAADYQRGPRARGHPHDALRIYGRAGAGLDRSGRFHRGDRAGRRLILMSF